MLNTDHVPVTESALLVIDVQDSFMVDKPKWERRNNKAFEANVGRLVDAYRAAGRPVVYFLHTDPDEGFRTDHPAYRLMSFLSPREGEPLFHKDTRNCFTSTGLGAFLLGHNVRRIAITGIQMEQCCETTARVAADLGYAVDFVIDGTLTFPIPNWDEPGRELDVQSIEERTAYALRRRFARIVKTGRLIDELTTALV